MAVSVLDIQVNSQGAVRNLQQISNSSKQAESATQRLTQAANGVTREMRTAANGMQYFIDAAGRARKANGQFVTSTEAAAAGIQKQAAAARGASGAIGSLTNKVAGLASSLAAGFAINKIISDVKELDTNIRRLGTVGIDVQKINPALAALSDRLGGVASKAELAAASYQAASAGFADTAGNIKILEAATKAATGGLADNQAVTEVLVKTLNAYGMSGTQAYEVTDSISKAVELGNQEWSDYTSQLGRVVSIAAVAGVSIDEMNAFIAAATKNGATAEVAFTGLSSVLTQLLQPTKESKDAAAKLNVQWNLMGLQTKGLGGLMKELAVAIDKDKESAARMVGPAEAMRGAFAAASKDGKDFEGILTQLGDAAGKTDADFTTMKGSLENTFKALDTSFKNLSEALGKAFGPTLVIVIQDITKGVNGFATAMSAVPQPVMNATGELIKFIVQMVLVQKAIQSVIALNAGITALFASTASGAVTAGGAAATATPLVNGLALALGRLAALGIITVGVNYVSNVVGEAMSLRQLQERRAKGGAAASFKGATRETVVAAQAAQRKNLAALAKKEKARQEKLTKDNALYQVPIIGPLALAAASPFIAGEQNKLFEQQQFSQGVLGLDPNKFKPSTPAAKPTTTLPPTPTPTGGSGSKPKKDTAADKAASAAAKLAEQTKAQLDNAYKLNDLAIANYAIQVSANDVEQLKGEFDKTAIERRTRYLELQKNALSPQERELLVNAQLNEVLRDNNKYAKDKKALLDEQLKPLADIIEANKMKLVDDRAYERLVAEGINPELAKQYVAIDRAGEAVMKAIKPSIDLAAAAVLEAKARGASADAVAELVKELERLQQLPGQQVGKARGLAEKTDVEDQAAQKLKDQAEQLKSLYTDIGMTIKSGVVDSIQGAVDGTKSLGEVAASVLNNIANKLLDVAVNMALFGAMSGTGTGGGLLGGLFKRAQGGPVSAGTPYMVGERGPELFMPSRGGSIIPNNALGGGGTSVVVNVDASGSNVQGDQSQAKQLGVAVSAAVQAELVKQQRPGGLLAGTRR